MIFCLIEPAYKINVAKSCTDLSTRLISLNRPGEENEKGRQRQREKCMKVTLVFPSYFLGRWV